MASYLLKMETKFPQKQKVFINTGVTFFSPIFKLCNKIIKIFSELEYLFETSLIPYRKSYLWRLNFDKNNFLKNISSKLKMCFTKKAPYIDIVLPPTNSKEKKPKIVHLIVWLGGIGGAPRMILDIVNGLNAKYRMEGITLSDNFYYKYSNFKVQHFSNPQNTLGYLMNNSPDIIHTYYYGDWEKFHQHFEAILNSSLSSVVIENLLVPIHIYRHPRINSYVFCSKYIHDMQHAKYANEIVIYPGVNTKEFSPIKNRKKTGAVGMAYRLWNDKIDQSTIEMFISIAKKRPKTLIYIIGSGFNFHHYIERVRQEKVRENFYFTGEVGYSDLASWYDKFDIFVAPIHNESYGLVVPYAMAKEKPIVAYRQGALPEVLGETNKLVNTSPEMVNTLINLLDHPEQTTKLTKGARKRVINNFSMEQMIKSYDILYKNLLKRRFRNDFS